MESPERRGSAMERMGTIKGDERLNGDERRRGGGGGFFGKLPVTLWLLAFLTAFLVAAARDGSGRPWATLLVGPEGFVTSPDPGTLAIEAAPPAGDAPPRATLPERKAAGMSRSGE